jgi:RNA polymerase sigma factor (sigma-70 family)
METRDEQFLSQLQAHAGIIHRICKSYFKEEELRKDVYQDIVYQLWKAYPSFKGLSKFSTWMYRIALNTAITYHRKAQRQPEELRLTDQADRIATSDTGDLEEQVGQLYAAINTLNDIEKAIVLLYLDEHSYEEIAAICGMNAKNIGVRLVRIKKKLEKYLKLKQNDYGHTR